MRFLVVMALLVAALWWQHPEWFRLPGETRAQISTGAVLYVAERCPACRDVERLLEQRGIGHERVDPTAGGEAEARYFADGGQRLLPMLAVDGQRDDSGRPMQVLGFLAKQYGPQVYTDAERAAVAAHFDAAGRPQVVMYATAWCGYCARARKWFGERGVAFIERDIEREPAAKADFDALQGQGTPLMFFGHERIDGYDQRRLAQVLDRP